MNCKLSFVAILAFSFFIRITAFAGEGMWIPLLLQSLNEKEMQSMGMKMSAEDIYSVNKGSLKDAIVHFGGFCTAELISGQGLLLTNHHCGYGQIQAHSSIDNNLLKDGFWAKTLDDELANPGLHATFIQRIEDVTDIVLAGVNDGLTSRERQSIIDQNINQVRRNWPLGEFEQVLVRPFYKGNQYYAFVTVTFNDVRLVGTPPESIGKFGADTDNWVWPRHTGDFSLFRIYADKDNNPAQYSEDNVPYNPRHFLPISLDGVAKGDFTMVFGFPGRTNQYLPSSAVDMRINKHNPAKIAMRDAALKVMDRYMREDEEVRLQYASKFARIANYWKKWIGETTGVKNTNGIARKVAYEKEFQKKVNKKKKLKKKYSGLLDKVQEAYRENANPSLARDLHNELMIRTVEIFRITRQLKLLKGSYDNHGEREYNAVNEKLAAYFEGFFESYRTQIDEEVLASQIDIYLQHYPEEYLWPQLLDLKSNYEDGKGIARHLFGQSKLTSMENMKKVLASGPEKFAMKLQKDPMYNFYMGINDHFDQVVDPVLQVNNENIKELQREYMAAQMEVFSKKRFYPDANGTLRVSYGYAEGYTTKEAGSYDYISYLDGVVEKYVPGDYEFDVHPKLLSLYEEKDYGQYAASNGKMPVCFIGSNHTSGGNSGSPAIDAHGNLIGLNFDRAWEGTMSDINYDRSICRNIMVDIRYVLFVVDKFAGATNLIEEMKLVRPKS